MDNRNEKSSSNKRKAKSSGMPSSSSEPNKKRIRLDVNETIREITAFLDLDNLPERNKSDLNYAKAIVNHCMSRFSESTDMSNAIDSLQLMIEKGRELTLWTTEDCSERNRIDSFLLVLTDCVNVIKASLNVWESSVLGKDGVVATGRNKIRAMCLGTDGMSVMGDEEPNRERVLEGMRIEMLRWCMDNHYFRFGDNMYGPRKSKEGLRTGAVELCSNISTFVESFYKFTDTDKSMVLNAGNNATWFKNRLRELVDPRLPDCSMDRYILSFSNGIMLTKDSGPDGNLRCSFHTYSSDEGIRVIEDMAMEGKTSAMYIDAEVPEGLSDGFDPLEVRTPYFDSILDIQGFDDEMKEWTYIMIGRMLYGVNVVDRWQVMTFLYGTAGCGKSTLINMFHKIFDPSKITVVNNTIETKFGIERFIDRFIILGTEIGSGYTMSEADFKTLVCGEIMAANQKNKVAVNMTAQGHILFAGNSLPSFENQGGSIGRRMIILPFRNKVLKTITNMDKLIADELGCITLKCAELYLRKVRELGDSGIWSAGVLPDRLTEENARALNEKCPIRSFIEERVVLGEGLSVPKDEFICAFSMHCKDRNLGVVPIDSSFYSSLVDSNTSIRVEKDATMDRNGYSMTGDWIVGCDLKSSVY